MTGKKDKKGKKLDGRARTQFKKGGPSPNPKGRPKGSRNVKSYILDELGKKVVVRIEGRERRVPKGHVVALRTVERGMRGEGRATDRLIDLDAADEEQHIPSNPEQAREDKLIIERFIERLRAQICREEGL